MSNLIELGFDKIVSAPSPQIWKKVLRAGFYKGNYLIGPELALYSSLPQIAIKYKINLKNIEIILNFKNKSKNLI